MGEASAAAPGRSIHDSLAVACVAFDLHQQSIRRVSPEKPRIEPEVFECGAADRAGEPPTLHPTAQPRPTGKHVRCVPMRAGSADLWRLPDRHQAAAHSAAARLCHVADQMRRAAQNIGKHGRVAARQAQVDVAHRWNLDTAVPQEAFAAHPDKGSVPVDPRREKFIGQRRQDHRQRADWLPVRSHANNRSFGAIGCHWSIAPSLSRSAPLLIASMAS